MLSANYGMYNNQGTRSVRPNPFNYRMDKYNFYWPILNSAITANYKSKHGQNHGYNGYDPVTPKWTTWQEAVEDESRVQYEVLCIVSI